MILGRTAALALGIVVLAAGCGSSGSGRAGPPATAPPPVTRPSASTATTPSTTASSCAAQPDAAMPAGGAGQSAYLKDLAFPVALAWAPDRRLFIAERAGTIKVADGTQVSVFTTVPAVTTQSGGGSSERGLLGLAVSPTFTTDHYVYALYSLADRQHEVVERWTDCAGRATQPTTLIELPTGSDCCHKGGRLAFGPDHDLYVTVGDEHSVPPPPSPPTPPNPQNPEDVRGKVLRYLPDGTIPSDNPFGPTSPVWIGGLRNPFGVAFGNGQALVTSNGPTGDAGSPGTGYDLAQLVTAGTLYQWPYCYGYSHPIAPYRSCQGRPAPDWSSETSTVVPTGATWVDAQGPAPEAGHFVFCNDVAGMRIFRPASAGSAHATLGTGPAPCLLDVKEGPDHALYYSDTTTVYRLG